MILLELIFSGWEFYSNIYCTTIYTSAHGLKLRNLMNCLH